MKTTNEERVAKLNATINNCVNSKNLISNNKGTVATKNNSNVADSSKIVASLKQAINNMCGSKSFKGLSFTKETAVWLMENRCTDAERRLCFNVVNKVDYVKLISLITRVQRAFAKEANMNKLLVGLTGDEYRIVFDNNCARLMW